MEKQDIQSGGGYTVSPAQRIPVKVLDALDAWKILDGQILVPPGVDRRLCAALEDLGAAWIDLQTKAGSALRSCSPVKPGRSGCSGGPQPACGLLSMVRGVAYQQPAAGFLDPFSASRWSDRSTARRGSPPPCRAGGPGSCPDRPPGGCRDASSAQRIPGTVLAALSAPVDPRTSCSLLHGSGADRYRGAPAAFRCQPEPPSGQIAALLRVGSLPPRRSGGAGSRQD